MKLTECKKASIYDLNHLYICDASVTILTSDTAALTFGEAGSDFLRSEVYVTFYDNIEGLVTFYCSLSNYKEFLIAPGFWNSSVICTMEEQLSVLQRRNDIKVAVHLDTVLSFTSEEDVLMNVSAIIRNISAGGIFFTCHYPFRKGQEFSFSFAPQNNAAVLTAEILRIQPHDEIGGIIGSESEDETIIGYGCRFINLSPYKESLIRNFVYKQDLYHKKGKYPAL